MVKILISTVSLIISITTLFAANKSSLKGDTVYITAHLRAHENFSIFYNNEDQVIFNNTSSVDTLIRKKVATQLPLEMRYGVTYTKDRKTSSINHKFFLSPGDSISFKMLDFDIIPVDKTPAEVFIDNWIKPRFGENGALSEADILAREAYLSDRYKTNLKRIDSLQTASVINGLTAKYWKNEIEIEYYKLLIGLWNSPKMITYSYVSNQKLDMIANQIKKLQLISNPVVEDLVSRLTAYQLKRANKDSKDINNNIQYTIDHYKQFGDVSFLIVYAWLYYYPNKRNPIYKKALLAGKGFLDMYNSPYLDKLNKADKGIFTDLEKVILTTTNAKSYTLKEIISGSGKSIVFIDLWASWCIPCRLQMPLLENFKEKFSISKVLFLTLSIDDDNANIAWINALKHDKLIEKDQFRIVTWKNSAMLRFFDVTTIPRYIILDTRGRVISDRFLTPDDPTFESQLSAIISQ